MTLFMLNPGHGIDTPGKRSPFVPPGVLEYDINRSIAKYVMTYAKDALIDTYLVNPETEAVQLKEICRRVNDNPLKSKFFLSIHANAAPGNGWRPKALGVTSFVAKNASNNSREAAKMLCDKVSKAFYTMNRGVKEKNLYVVKHTKCPAVLLECGFMTNPQEATMLADHHWRREIAKAIVECMKTYVVHYR
jgi:N-acetylmuramoyl-L-alanine amidase